MYRATDTKLNRSVAIKMLALDFADAEARRRFQREAQLASSLNHPHILRCSMEASTKAGNTWSPSFAKLDPRSGTENLYMAELTGGPGNVITSAPGDEFGTVWLGDETIVFTRDNKAVPFLHQLKLDGSGSETKLTAPSGQVQLPTSRLPDGAIVYQDFHPETRNDVWLLRPGENRSNGSRRWKTKAAVSPDGAWLAYVSDATGSQQVYVRAITTRLGPPRRISLSGGLWPRWSRDGRELYFLQSGRLMLRTNPQSEGGSVTELFRPSEGLVDYDVAPGGNFVVNLGKVGYNVAPITVVIGWESMLKR